MLEHRSTLEFRAFDLDVKAVAARWAADADTTSEEETTECYLVTRLSVDVGVKVRRSCFEVKELLAREGLLERWKMRISEPMPIQGAVIGQIVAPLLGVDLPVAERARLDEDTLEGLARSLPALAWLTLTKRRTLFHFAGGTAETVDVTLGDLQLQSAAVEAHDPHWALEAIAMAGIEMKDNESYPSRLQRLAFAG